jgi:hypothetical protein
VSRTARPTATTWESTTTLAYADGEVTRDSRARSATGSPPWIAYQASNQAGVATSSTTTGNGPGGKSGKSCPSAEEDTCSETGLSRRYPRAARSPSNPTGQADGVIWNRATVPWEE